MKLITFCKDKSSFEIGILIDNDQSILPLNTPEYPTLLDLIKREENIDQLVKSKIAKITKTNSIPIDQVEVLPPIPIPESIRACMAFEQHIINCTRQVGLGKLAFLDEAIENVFGRKFSIAKNVNKTFYKHPIYYKSNRFSVVGHNANIIIPSYAKQLDYELEWGVIIGKKGKNIEEKNAREYIAGYTIFNDFSARDIQLKEMKGRLGPSKGKDFDTGNAIGPCLVTPDEIVEPYNLQMKAIVNEEEWSLGTTADMYWSFEEMISYISKSETLYPGEFIGSGTCSGITGMGCGLEHGKYLQPGDEIELYVEKIGSLKNKITSENERVKKY